MGVSSTTQTNEGLQSASYIIIRYPSRGGIVRQHSRFQSTPQGFSTRIFSVDLRVSGRQLFPSSLLVGCRRLYFSCLSTWPRYATFLRLMMLHFYFIADMSSLVAENTSVVKNALAFLRLCCQSVNNFLPPLDITIWLLMVTKRASLRSLVFPITSGLYCNLASPNNHKVAVPWVVSE